jgi:hypothetical protein
MGDAIRWVKSITKLRQIVGAKGIHETVQRGLTIPAAQRTKLHAGMNSADKAQADELHHKAADALADYFIFVASNGSIDPD